MVDFVNYKRQFRTVLQCDRAILQEAYVSPGAKRGSDVLDLEGEATSIEVLAAHDPSRKLGGVTGEGEVRALTSLVLAGPVRPSAGDWDARRVIVVFRMEDELNVVRWYGPESGELTPITAMRTTAVAPSAAFGVAIERASAGR